MSGFFPDPYPDELFYSVCARFQDLVQYSNYQLITQELFGIRKYTLVVDLPTHLGHLVATLPSGHRYTVDRLIDESTLFPFYSPFLPPKRAHSLRQAMSESDGKGYIHFRAGISASTISPPAHLRFCPLCAVEDRGQFGEPYWHRLHQVPGVEVCPTHAVFLEKSSVCVQAQSNSLRFVPAKQAIAVTSRRTLDLSVACHKELLKIADDAAWLLNQQGLVFSLESLRNRYIYLLAIRGLATYSGRLNLEQLLKAFKNYYSPELLKLLQCEVDEQSAGNWLARLVRPPKGTQHPLHHLLLMHFLGQTTETFFNLPSEFKPFGEGPWPCLNSVCTHFQKLQIQECQINYSNNGGTPIGIFSCECGFIYSRKDFGQSITGNFRVSTVKSYGPLWESLLKELWKNSALSLSAIAERLGVSFRTVKHQAVRLQLSLPRIGSLRRTQIGKKDLPRLAENQAKVLNKLEIYRNEWLFLLKENPDAARTSLVCQARRVYDWLRKRDSEWLEAHLPPPRKKKGSYYVDRESKDVQLAEAVRQSAIRIKNATGHPVKITKHAIGRDINQLSCIFKRLNKLPLTALALDEVVETQDEYRVRVAQWATECMTLHDTAMKCPRCTSDQITKNSHLQRKPNYICQDCNFLFAESGIGNGYSSEIRKHCLKLHVDGFTSKTIARMTGISTSTVNNWVRQATTLLADDSEATENIERIDTVSNLEISKS